MWLCVFCFVAAQQDCLLLATAAGHKPTRVHCSRPQPNKAGPTWLQSGGGFITHASWAVLGVWPPGCTTNKFKPSPWCLFQCAQGYLFSSFQFTECSEGLVPLVPCSYVEYFRLTHEIILPFYVHCGGLMLMFNAIMFFIMYDGKLAEGLCMFYTVRYLFKWPFTVFS